MESPNAALEKFLGKHITTDGKCSCGWDIANYDIEPYEWEENDKPARRRAWIAHVQRVWRDGHPLEKIQQAKARDPNGDEVVFDMEPGHDTLSETPRGLGRRYHGEYRYADYEPPPRDDDRSTSITCEEAGCRDPHCLGGHFRTTATYHKACRPSEEELREHAEELWPTPEPEQPEPELRQAMACLSCGLAGEVPEDHFPQEPGLWDRPCPKCGEIAVWVTETAT